MSFVEPPDGPHAASVRLLSQRGLTLATAESLTAGLLSTRLSQVPGASDVLLGGVAAYARQVKAHLFDVDPEHVVSSEAAQAMAEGVRDLLGADVGISLTGVAGPTTQDGQRVGTVFVGLALPDQATRATRLWLPGEPDEVREGAAADAASLLVEALLAVSSGDGTTPADEGAERASPTA